MTMTHFWESIEQVKWRPLLPRLPQHVSGSRLPQRVSGSRRWSSRDHKVRRTIEALHKIYPSGLPDDSCQERLDKVNKYHHEHGYQMVGKMTVYRALRRMGWRS
jgi:hypothetical protein